MIQLYPHQDVLAFHQKFGLLTFHKPGHLTKRKLKERVEFLLEELQEFATSCDLRIADLDGKFQVIGTATTVGPQDLAGQADALVDLVYVALGTAVMLGLPWNELWDDVQRANMAKVRKETHRGHKVDVGKPEGWVPPMTLAILERHGYRQSDAHKLEAHHDDVP